MRRTHHERLSKDHRNTVPDARRAPPDRLQREIRAVSESPVVCAILEATDSALLVLNAERQIVGFNSSVDDVRTPGDVLGRRLGEAFGCTHACAAGECGAAPACRSCGALSAVLACQARGRTFEAECVIDGGIGRALEFNVRVTPVDVESCSFTVVSLRDISAEKRREVLEQVFFHDVLNTVAGLRGWADRLRRAGADLPRASDRIDGLTRQLEREIRDQRSLLLAESGALVPERARLRTGELLSEVAAVFSSHPVARDRRLELAPGDDVELVSDRSLLVRVLVNMVRNAFEATQAGGVVRLACERDDDGAVRLLVRNAGVIPPEVQLRIFQRSFSTKAERGRGLGTYAMKLFGERYLGGEVSFASTPERGTVFCLRLRQSAPATRG